LKRIKIITIGKNKDQYIQNGIHDFQNKIKHFCDIEIKYLKDQKNPSLNSIEIIDKETDLIHKELLSSKFHNIFLEINGKEFNSIQWSELIENKIIKHEGLNFIIGGPYGFDTKKLKKFPGISLSLSKLTFNHQIIRLMLLEQIYRGFTIIHGLPYHK